MNRNDKTRISRGAKFRNLPAACRASNAQASSSSARAPLQLGAPTTTLLRGARRARRLLALRPAVREAGGDFGPNFNGGRNNTSHRGTASQSRAYRQKRTAAAAYSPAARTSARSSRRGGTRIDFVPALGKFGQLSPASAARAQRHLAVIVCPKQAAATPLATPLAVRPRASRCACARAGGVLTPSPNSITRTRYGGPACNKT